MGCEGFAGGYPAKGFATEAITAPCIYDPSAPPGKRWSPLLADSHVPRYYHSTLLLLPTGEVRAPAAHNTQPCARVCEACACGAGNGLIALAMVP